MRAVRNAVVAVFVLATVCGPRAAPAQTADDAYFDRVAGCENRDGGGDGNGGGYFQFSRDTAAKVGYSAGASYEAQREMAKSWAGRVNPGSTAGWPHCWHVAANPDSPVAVPASREPHVSLTPSPGEDAVPTPAPPARAVPTRVTLSG